MPAAIANTAFSPISYLTPFKMRRAGSCARLEEQILKERIVCFLQRHGCERSMTWAKQCLWRQSKDLLPNFLPQYFSGLFPPRHRARKNRVTNDGGMRSVLGPVADYVRDSILGMPRCFAVGNAQAAQVNKIVGPIAMLWRGIFGIGVQMKFG